MSSSNCCFLTCIQVSQEAGKVVWYSYLFQYFSVCYDPNSQGFSIKSKVFLEFLCFYYDPVYVGNLISGSSPFSKTSLKIWKFMVHILLKPGLEIFKHYFISVWNECNCAIVWAFFGIAFLWDCIENWPIAKFRLKLKKVEKTTRPFRYDLNQIPCDYTVEVRNRFKRLDLIDRVPDELCTEVCDIVQETGIKTIPIEKKCKKSKWLRRAYK